MSEEKSATEAGSSLSRRQFVLGSAAGVLAAGTLVPKLALAGFQFQVAESYDLWKFEAMLDQGFYVVDLSTWTARLVTLVDLDVRSEAPDQFQTVFQDSNFPPLAEGIYNMFNFDGGLFQMHLSPGGEDESGYYYTAWVSLLT